MTRKKNKFFTFCFSLLPGAAHMYMGFMKTGVSLMGSFFFIIFLASTFSLDAILFILPIIWFYSFFDALNKNSIDEEEFYQLEDDYLFHIAQIKQLQQYWNEKGTVWIAFLLILGGIYLLIDEMMEWLLEYFILDSQIRELIYSIYSKIPSLLLSVVIILIGIRLIRGKKQQLGELERRDLNEK